VEAGEHAQRGDPGGERDLEFGGGVDDGEEEEGGGGGGGQEEEGEVDGPGSVVVEAAVRVEGDKARRREALEAWIYERG
jgi:hypothetical protein